MKDIRRYLEKLRKVKKRKYHPIKHKIHKKYKVSRKTLFYVKEYGYHKNIPKTIMKESIKILLFAAILSSFGGFALENIKLVFVSIIPMIIMLPILNDMIGNYGTIISSNFSTLLHEDKVKGKWYKNKKIRALFLQVIIVSIIMAIISSSIALIISSFTGYILTIEAIYRIFLICIIDVASLISILFLVVVFGGLYLYKRSEDPDNFLIPITTSIADFGNMILLATLVILLF